MSQQHSFLKRAERRPIRIGKKIYEIWMVLDMDALIEDFIFDAESQNKSVSCPYGATLWPSTRAFADWATQKTLVDANYFHKFESAIELGCGVGVAACLLAKLGVPRVVATDAEPDLGWLVKKNTLVFDVSTSVSFEDLLWTDFDKAKKIGTFPLVTAFDVLYEPEHIIELPKIAYSLLRDDGVFILGDPRRFCFESAIEELKKYFDDVSMEKIYIEHESADVKQGVSSKNVEGVYVEMITCRGKKKLEQ